MKRFLYKIILFVITIVICDIIVGITCRKLVKNARSGDTRYNYYMSNRSKCDMLIIGSSRALHHYDPKIFEDSLGLSCQNWGLGGQGIVLMYGRFKLFQERHWPKIILCEVTPGFDLLENDNCKYLLNLRPYYDRQSIDSIFWKVDKNEKFKMMSQCYRYNSQLLYLLKDNIICQQCIGNGYIPLHGSKPHINQSQKDSIFKYDSIKLYYLEKLIKDCKGKTKLIFISSPWFTKPDDKVYFKFKKLCLKYNVTFYNHYCDKKYIYRYDYYVSGAHLNSIGSNLFTKEIASEIKKYINNKCKE
jgi:hypothetical protein